MSSNRYVKKSPIHFKTIHALFTINVSTVQNGGMGGNITRQWKPRSTHFSLYQLLMSCKGRGIIEDVSRLQLESLSLLKFIVFNKFPNLPIYFT